MFTEVVAMVTRVEYIGVIEYPEVFERVDHTSNEIIKGEDCLVPSLK